MSGFNNHEEQDAIPPLLPLKKKKIQHNPIATPSDKNSISNEALNNIIKDSIKNTPTNQVSKDTEKGFNQAKKQPNPQKIREIEERNKQKISTLPRRDNQINKIQMERSKENEKMKSLIAQMLNSISVKNTAQQLYPISNEVMDSLLGKIQDEIENLNNEAQKKQSTLSANPNNTHLKNQLQSINRQIDHCSQIKELYYQKMNYRNKIRILQQKILRLENENSDIKKKVGRGIQTVQSYKHNMPCEREKDLNQKLNICKEQLSQEREMRQNLQKNIEGIIMNFKRLYDQADAARLIVTKKLRQVEERQKKIKKSKIQEEEEQSQDLNAPARRVASLQITEQKKMAGSHNQANDYSQTHARKLGDNEIRKSTYYQKINSTIPTRQKQEKKGADVINASMTMQQKIKKMRSNQIAITRALAN